MQDTKQKRMSIRAVAIEHGLPARVVARAVETGELPAIKSVTETGRERVYINPVDAAVWVSEKMTVLPVHQIAQAR